MRYSSILLLGASPIALARVAPALPVITPGPSLEQLDLRRRENSMDLASLAEVLLTAVPPSILGLALTNVPAVSKLLWSEFLDDNTPEWFTALPTDVQQYLSGEFGPTTAASNSASTSPASSQASATSSGPAASESALKNQYDSSKHGGLPLWAKIVLGIAIPLIVLGFAALILLCCMHRRRRHRASRPKGDSRAPTPAFVSSSYRPSSNNPPGEQHLPSRDGYLLSSDGSHHTPGSSHEPSSASDDYRTPIGGPSYEELSMPPAAGIQNSRRGSRQSFTSLHSVPEVPEPMHDRLHERRYSAMTSRSSRNRIKEANMNTGSQETLNGGYIPYTSPYQSPDVDYRYSNPFSDPSPHRNSHYMASGGYRGSAGREPELFIPGHGPGHAEVPEQPEYGSEWPLKSPHEADYGMVGRSRENPWDGGGNHHQIYEM